MPQVVTLGDINVDILARIPFYPPPGGDSLAEGVDLRAGGSAANTSAVLSKFGLEVSILARVGQDALAEHALSDLRRVGVDLSLVQRDADTQIGLIFAAVTPDGERTFFSCRGANANTTLDGEGEKRIRDARLLHVSGYALVENPQRAAALQAIAVAHRSGVTVSVDLGVEVKTTPREGIVEALSKTSMLFPNLAVAQWLTDKEGARESLEGLLSLGPELVGLKLREEGCLIGSGEGVFAVPAFGVEPVDDTGAGDSFDAGLILGRVAGLGLRECGILGNALGALATTVTGAGSSLPGPEDALSFLEERSKDVGRRDWREELPRVSACLETGRSGRFAEYWTPTAEELRAIEDHGTIANR
jgi:ribokinase